MFPHQCRWSEKKPHVFNILLNQLHQSPLFHLRLPLDSSLYCKARTMSNQNIRVMNVCHTFNLSPSSWVVLSSGRVWSRYFPAVTLNCLSLCRCFCLVLIPLSVFLFSHCFQVLISARRSMLALVWKLVFPVATEGTVCLSVLLH